MSPEPPAAVHRHVDLLGLLFVVGGALSGVAALALVSLGAGALSTGWFRELDDRTWAAHAAGIGFLVIAVVVGTWGAINAWVGRAIRRRAPWARLIALVLAILHLFVLPFGTALGGYTLWVLLGEGGRKAFEPPPRGPVGVR